MAVINVKKNPENSGIIQHVAVAEVLAETADDAAGSIAVDLGNQLQNIEAMVVQALSSTGLPKPLLFTRSGTTVTIADDSSTTTIAADDVITIIAFGKPKRS